MKKLDYTDVKGAKVELKVENVQGIKVVVPYGGHLDVSNREVFRSSLERSMSDVAVASSLRIVLDLSNIRFVDSSGLGVIMTILKRIRANGGDMVACHISKPVQVLFDLVRLDRVMSVFEDQSTAIASFISPSRGTDDIGPIPGAR